MAKIFGPYSQYAISESGRFFGFDENDDNLLKYKMSDDVVQAIQESFSLIRDDTSPVFFTKYWPADAQKTIEFYNEIFKDAEVIPYVYYLEEQYITKKPTNGAPQNFVPCSALIAPSAPQFGSAVPMAYSAGFENDGDVLAFSSFEDSSAIDFTNYLWGGAINADILRRCRLATKSEHASVVLKPDIWNVDDLKEGNIGTTWKNYKSLKSLFNISGSIVDPFDIDSVYTFAQMKEKFAGMKFIKSFDIYDNSADGSYSKTNQRQRAGSLYDGTLTSQSYPWDPDIGRSNKGKNSFVFFVKTFAPWYNADGTVDNSREPVQYWCFNIATLFAQRFFTQQYSFNWSLTNITDGAGAGFLPESFRDGSFVGLGIQSKTATHEGPVPQNFFIPFAWNIKQTRYFTNAEVIGDYAASVDWNYEIATQNGTSLGFYDSNEMLNFLVNGLGLPATFNDDELLFKSVEDWERDFPTGNVPGAGGQVGGLTGGGQGSGIGETFDDVGPASSSTRGVYTQSSYILNEINMKHLQEAMVNDSLWATITNMFKNNPQDGVINLIRFPINFDNIISIQNENVKILGVDISEMGETGYVRGTKIPNEILTSFDLGYFDFPERFGSFLDFEPYTKTTLFLPFVGFKQISTDAIIGRRVRIHYDVDYSDGSALCVVRVSNARTTGIDFSSIESMGFTPLYTFDAQIGQMIPLTQNNAQQKNQSLIKNALTATASIGVGVATGGMGAAAAVAGVSSAVMNAANTILDKTQYNASGAASSQQAYAINDLTPYVVIDFPEVNIPNGFQQYSGYITNLYQKMSSMRGFTQFDNVRITGVNCTADEESELKNLLESGVIINE